MRARPISTTSTTATNFAHRTVVTYQSTLNGQIYPTLLYTLCYEWSWSQKLNWLMKFWVMHSWIQREIPTWAWQRQSRTNVLTIMPLEIPSRHRGLISQTLFCEERQCESCPELKLALWAGVAAISLGAGMSILPPSIRPLVGIPYSYKWATSRKQSEFLIFQGCDICVQITVATAMGIT